MPGQRSFSDFEYAKRKRITKRESFLKMMDEIIPWSEWIELIRPFYPRGDRGRPPQGNRDHVAHVPGSVVVQPV